MNLVTIGASCARANSHFLWLVRAFSEIGG
jgi:hypothetical protein